MVLLLKQSICDFFLMRKKENYKFQRIFRYKETIGNAETYSPWDTYIRSRNKNTKVREDKDMWDYGYNEEAMMNLRDSLVGIVKGQNRSGLHIDLQIENDKTDEYKETVRAFGYWPGRVPKGTKVFCSIKRPAKDDKDILVNIDSVDYESNEMAA